MARSNLIGQGVGTTPSSGQKGLPEDECRTLLLRGAPSGPDPAETEKAAADLNPSRRAGACWAAARGTRREVCAGIGIEWLGLREANPAGLLSQQSQ